ncbi:MAG: sigma-54 dependent transcriptional regulator [Planctomycetota bacterium]|nr:sigma-54 dependent transcriptional regulator [Planctomycetota bacterium]
MTPPRHTVLIADDEAYMRDDLGELLAARGYATLFAKSAAEAVAEAEARRPDLVLLDLLFPDCRDLTTLRRIRQLPDPPEIVILSGQTENIPLVVEAIKAGAFDYVPKPFAEAELLNRIEKALGLRALKRSHARLLQDARGDFGPEALVGESAPMRQVRETLRKLADFEGCVLVRGESGTGKELAARALHYLSRRASSPFVVVNCAAIPEALTESVLFGHRKGAFTGAIESSRGKFEQAEDGTLFLDEIGDMPLKQQAALLRVLEYRTFAPLGEARERECRARFVLATNRDLRAAVAAGAFREDLFHRINVSTVALPALSSRPEDLPRLAEFFCAKLSVQLGRPGLAVEPEALMVFRRYDWPGNVRELRNVLEAATMLLDPGETSIGLARLPAELLASREASEAVLSPKEQREKEELVAALRKFHGNQSKAAQALGYHRNTIRSKIRYFGITLSEG